MLRTNFLSNGRWYKGNLHCHSTQSDGSLPPQEVARAYREHGYDFLCLTDHNIFSSLPQLSTPDFLMIPGMELSAPLRPGITLHIGVIQKEEGGVIPHGKRFALADSTQTREAMAQLSKDHLLCLNHPYWSMLEPSYVEDLRGFTLTEIYNYGTELMESAGESPHFWDSLLRRDIRLWGVAADDNHNSFPEAPGWPFDLPQCDSFGGFVMVKAEGLSISQIAGALAQGSFYASGGPLIHDFYVEGDEVVISCSPVRRIVLSCDHCRYQREIGEDLTQWRTKLHGSERYVRVTCVDEQGRTAYANPIFLD